MSYSVDMRHYLDDEGRMPDFTGPALTIVQFMGSSYEYFAWRDRA